MVTREPGWYPDPDGERQVRFWDGDTWTEYVQPFAPPSPEPHGSQTAVEDYPYLASTPTEPGTGAYSVATWADAPVRAAAAPTAATGGGPGGGSRRNGLYLGIAVGVVVVVVLVVVSLLTRGSGDAGPGPGPDPTDGLQQGAPIQVGATSSDRVAAGATWEAPLTVDDGDTFLVDLTGTGGDLVLEIRSDTGDLVWQADDRGRELAEIMGGDSLDPGGLVELDAGEYVVSITEYNEAEQDFDLLIEAARTTVLTPGMSASLDVADSGFAIAEITFDAPTPIAVDVRATGGSGDDPRIVLVLPPDGRLVDVDDRTDEQQAEHGGGTYDPYFETDVQAGTVYLFVAEYYGDDLTVDVTISAR